MSKAKILLVDDEVTFANNMSRLLAKRGYEVSVVHGGEDALRKVENEEYDVVILDLKMPGMDGLDTLKVLKKRKPFIEVIILTGHGSVDSAVDGMHLGAFDYVTKPVYVEDLNEKIRQAHQRKMMQESKGADGTDVRSHTRFVDR
ncbi:MAG TPA: response regulator [Syntrophobacteraceae bacterium]|nr:response regulator [Syntrophobacteraceae bacterium]